MRSFLFDYYYSTIGQCNHHAHASLLFFFFFDCLFESRMRFLRGWMVGRAYIDCQYIYSIEFPIQMQKNECIRTNTISIN